MKYWIYLLLLSFFCVSQVSALESVSASDEAKLRDTVRIMTLSSISSAVEQYYQDNAEYPSTRKELAKAISIYSNLSSQLDDPLSGKKWAPALCRKGYVYEVYSDQNGIRNWAYKLSSCLEARIEKAANDGGMLPNSYEIGIEIGQKRSATKKIRISKSSMENAMKKLLSVDQYRGIFANAYVEGNSKAKITLVEYSDLECPFCIMQRQNKVIAELRKKYGDSINVIYKPVNLVQHPGADEKGMAALCVAQLGGTHKYAKYYGTILDESYMEGPVYPLDKLSKLAKNIGINEKKFNACTAGKNTEALYKGYATEATSLSINGTPTTLILNNETLEYDLVPGAYPIETFEKVIDGLMGAK